MSLFPAVRMLNGAIMVEEHEEFEGGWVNPLWILLGIALMLVFLMVSFASFDVVQTAGCPMVCSFTNYVNGLTGGENTDCAAECPGSASDISSDRNIVG